MWRNNIYINRGVIYRNIGVVTINSQRKFRTSIVIYKNNCSVVHSSRLLHFIPLCYRIVSIRVNDTPRHPSGIRLDIYRLTHFFSSPSLSFPHPAGRNPSAESPVTYALILHWRTQNCFPLYEKLWRHTHNCDPM